MAAIAKPEFLSHLKSLYPEQPSYLQNPWYLVAAVSFSASNMAEAVPFVFQYAINDLTSQSTDNDDHKLLVRKMKDMIFKSGLISGFPKAINAIAALHQAVPDDLRDSKPLRDVSMSIESLACVGQDLFSRTYGDTAETVQPFLKDIYPDLEFFSTTFGYGYTYGFSQVTGALETSYAMVAALIASDTPRQIDWHLNGAVRNGASTTEVRAVRQISIDVAQAAGVVWKNDIPDLKV